MQYTILKTVLISNIRNYTYVIRRCTLLLGISTTTYFWNLLLYAFVLQYSFKKNGRLHFDQLYSQRTPETTWAKARSAKLRTFTKFPFLHFSHIAIDPTNENTGANRIITKSTGGNSQNTPCYFPFRYNGVDTRQCIYTDDQMFYWCATVYNYDNDMQFGACPDSMSSTFSVWIEFYFHCRQIIEDRAYIAHYQKLSLLHEHWTVWQGVLVFVNKYNKKKLQMQKSIFWS